MELRPLSELEPRALTWLWPNQLAEGHLAMLDGDPNLGKSVITLDLAARLSTGRPFPDGQASPGPAQVLIFCAEDNDESTIRPRLTALGADLSRVFVWRSEWELPRFPSKLRLLRRLLKGTRAKLVIIDPIIAFLDGNISMNNDQKVRVLLHALLRVAKEYGSCIVLVRHLNKRGGPALYRGAGCMSFSAVCRLGWLVGPDAEDETQRVLAQQKNNLAEPQPSLSYRLVNTSSDVPVIEWRGVSPCTAEDLVARRSVRARRRMQARAFLREFLKDGPRLANEIYKAGRERRFNDRTLRRAAEGLPIRCERMVQGHKTFRWWLLGDQQVPAEFRPPSETPNFDACLDHMEKQYPRLPDDALEDDAA